jgi:hypothetical protein
MAIASDHSGASPTNLDTRFDVSARFMNLFGAICGVSSVDRIGIAEGDEHLDVWIFLGRDGEAEEERIYSHIQAYRALGSRPSVDAHVVGPDEGAFAFPEDVAIVFERA